MTKDIAYLPRPDSLLHNATGRRRMVRLALSFHSLERAPLADRHGEFDPVYFARWANRELYSHGARCAAQFILSVWNCRVRWRIGRFDLQEAMQCWDLSHREAFLAWAREPWWP